ncbi:lamin tail domain-containing protein [Flavobacteriaceae bacterium GSB9]|nr:lamin tail domain-containing protein [Flavobacteriaceae bacterium GSB9]
MKSIKFTLIALFTFNFGGAQMNDLIISEYAEGSSNNKYIEIFNGTGVDINLSDYAIWRVSNGGTWTEATINLTGTLTNGSTYVVANGAANTSILSFADLISGSVNWNGNDAVGLAKDNGSGTYLLIDTIGTDGPDPGLGWDISGIIDATSEHTLVRKPSVCSTNTNWISSAGTNSDDSEWIVLNQDDWSDLGSHTTSCCIYSTTWTAAGWSNGAPTLNTSVIINADYNTSTDGGSFSACTLTLNNAILTIADNTFVEVQNDLIVNTDGTINVQPQGAFIQNNDLGTITNNGTIQVDKETAPMNAWYEYTYWSAPVSGAEIGVVLGESEPKRRYLFNAQNFLDATAETNNNNSTANGQDDVDDDNNDWQWVSANTIMQPGIGYATTLTKFAYDNALGESEKTFRFTFEGDFNNGEYLVPIYRNDSELNDNNWNFIGNPYPSAIDADLFLAANSNISTDISGTDSNGTSYIDGAIFLWSQNTPPSATNNGNQKFNFSNEDYAIINVMGQTAGGDGVTPSRNIPSGQGFFVAMSNTAPANLVSGDIYTTNIIFRNAMRVANTTANSQFFKGTKKKSKSEFNKLWLNLTSDNGVFNQILVGYVNGATPKDDGISYDTPKYANKGATLYSTIENCDKKFAIQGKDVNRINKDEVIKLGFSTTIEVPTLYTLSIPKMEGEFFNIHSAFIKDNLLNTAHDITNSDYTFTSEIGEFNNRFEIVFKSDALSTTDALLPSQLKIAELKNDNVQFTAPNNLHIKMVSIFDLFGRQLYNLKGKNNVEVYKLSNLKSSVYIAKVKLSNGAVISKKAIKK